MLILEVNMDNISSNYRMPSDYTNPINSAQDQAFSETIDRFQQALKDIESSSDNPSNKMRRYQELSQEIGKEIEVLLQSPDPDKEKLAQLLNLHTKVMALYQAARLERQGGASETDKPFGMR